MCGEDDDDIILFPFGNSIGLCFFSKGVDGTMEI